MRYRKRPIEVDAIHYDPPNNCRAVYDFIGWKWTEELADDAPDDAVYHDPDCDNATPLFINTLEGLMEASPGDWIIRGVQGEFYPCKPDIFDATYDALEVFTSCACGARTTLDGQCARCRHKASA